MGLLELFILAIGLSMDAFAVSICKGLSLGRIHVKHMCIAGAWFGGFQALMPLAGFFLGSFFSEIITKYDHWVAFVLLAFIGGNMIRESLDRQEECADPSMAVGPMFLLAVATSIDALAVGVTFAFLSVRILPAVCFIGVTTFVCSAIGVKIGSIFGARYKSRAEFLGGAVLVIIGLIPLFPGPQQTKLAMVAVSVAIVNVLNAVHAPGISIWYMQSLPNRVRNPFFSLITM